jgi:hypothetical protein
MDRPIRKKSSFGGAYNAAETLFTITASWAHFPPGLRGLSCADQSEPILYEESVACCSAAKAAQVWL